MMEYINEISPRFSIGAPSSLSFFLFTRIKTNKISRYAEMLTSKVVLSVKGMTVSSKAGKADVLVSAKVDRGGLAIFQHA